MEITTDLNLYKALVYIVKNYYNGKIEIPRNYFLQESTIEFSEDIIQDKLILRVKE